MSEHNVSRASRVSSYTGLLDEIALKGGPEPATRLFDEQDLEVLRPHLMRVATDVLNERDLELFTLYLSQGTTLGVAGLIGKNQSTVHRALFGTPKAGRRHGGIMPKVAAVLDADEAFRAAVASLPVVDESEDASRPSAWFSDMRAHARGPAALSAVLHRAVLMVASDLADTKRIVSLSTVMGVMPPGAVDASIGPLRAGGWIRLEGMNIRILKTPPQVHA